MASILDSPHWRDRDLTMMEERNNRKRETSFLQTIFNSIILLIGLGTLSSPYALYQSGWIGILLSLCVTICYFRTSYFMYRCQKDDSLLMSYQDIAYKTLPKFGKVLLVILFYLETLGTLTGFVISIVDNLTYIFSYHRIRIGLLNIPHRLFFSLISAFTILPTIWLKRLSSISFLSLSCVICFIVTFISLLAIGFGGVGFSHTLPIVKPPGLPLAIGVFAFSYGGIGVFPTVYTSMKNKRQFPMVLMISFSIAICCYALLGVVGVLMFGDAVKSQVTLNMPQHLLASKIAIWATVATPITKFSLLLSPVAVEMEDWCLNHFHLKEKLLCALVMSKFLRAMLLFITILIAFVVPYFGYMIELVGSTMTATICMIFPCIFYLRCHCQRLTMRQIIEVYFLMTVSSVVGILGTYLSFKGLVSSKLNS